MIPPKANLSCCVDLHFFLESIISLKSDTFCNFFFVSLHNFTKLVLYFLSFFMINFSSISSRKYSCFSLGHYVWFISMPSTRIFVFNFPWKYFSFSKIFLNVKRRDFCNVISFPIFDIFTSFLTVSLIRVINSFIFQFV